MKDRDLAIQVVDNKSGGNKWSNLKKMIDS